MKSTLSIPTLGLLAALAACNPDSVQPVEPPVIKPQLPADTIKKPTQRPDTLSVFKKTKISWAETDYQEVEYDASNTPFRCTVQNLSVQGTDKVRKVVYDLIYTDKQLTRVNESTGLYVLYSYTGDKVSRTEEFLPSGQLSTSRVYFYTQNNQLHRILETQTVAGKVQETTKTFFYTQQGNLSQQVMAVKDEATGTFQVQQVTRYSDYDSQRNVRNLWAVYPFLPNVTFQVNNPGAIANYVRVSKGEEQLANRTTYSYYYNEQGYPVAHKQTSSGFTLAATYSYVGH